ncbi:MAG: radical SAM protein [Planctomycetes bacterium]|nr:radical SAM protein [Planctomycetota bacterium]
MGWEPAYLATYRSGLLAEKVERGLELLRSCRVCPRNCDVDRLAGKYAVCLSGRHAVVSSHFPHLGEEDCLRGWKGSGTIFFCYCNLKCVFCQNWDISQAAPRRAPGVPPERLAGMMLELQDVGCHNINFVTPEHVVPQILEALPLAIRAGLRLPLVYNTSAFDSAASLELMDGVVDIYMPDFKFWNEDVARRYVKAQGYPEAARQGIREMQRQVGDLDLDGNGIARRGVLVRHLVMPGGLAGTREVMRWLVQEVSPDVYVNVMPQYRPAGRVNGEHYPEIDRPVTDEEFEEAVRIAREEGVRRFDVRRPHPELLLRLLARG